MLNRLLAGARKISSSASSSFAGADDGRRSSSSASDGSDDGSNGDDGDEDGHSVLTYVVGLQAVLVAGNWAWKRFRRSQRKAGGAGRKRSLSGGGLRMY